MFEKKDYNSIEIKRNLNGLNIINGTLNLHGILHSPKNCAEY